ncbi:MAG: hypothetical protein ACK5Q5_06690 [Planctomycetaceae bacterium]
MNCSSSSWTPFRCGVAAAFVVLAAIGLRLVRLSDDMWLDEIWSVRLSEQMTTLSSVFTLHHDNNNFLNTLWQWLIGPLAPTWQQRLLTLIAGIAAVPLTMLVAWQWSPVERRNATAMLAGVLAAGWQTWIMYSNEARGYALACALSLATTALLPEVCVARPRRSRLLAFALLSTVGFVSHLSYLIVFTSQLIWCTVVVWTLGDPSTFASGRARVMQVVDRWVALAMLPVGVVAILWVADLRFAAVGGSSERDRLGVLIEALASVAGFLEPLPLALATGAATIAVLAAGFLVMRRTGTPLAYYPLILILLSPVILFGLAPTGFVWPRHFMTVSTAALPLMAVALASGLAAAGSKRLLAIGYLLIFFVGNGLELERYYRDGRGHYSEAVAWMASQQPTGVIRVSGDHTFRQSTLVEHFARRLHLASRFEFIPPQELTSPPDFFLTHDLDRNWTPPQGFELGPYHLQLSQRYGSIGTVGWPMAIYRPVK